VDLFMPLEMPSGFLLLAILMLHIRCALGWFQKACLENQSQHSSGLLPVFCVSQISLLADRNCEALSGGAKPSFGSLLGGLGGLGGASALGRLTNFNQSTASGDNVVGIGSTGNSLISIGVLYL
jgi:hypothetical protein